jgi:hypothetical protein
MAASQRRNKSHVVELSVTKALLPNLLDLVRAWLIETGCKPIRVEQAEARDLIVLHFAFAAPESARETLNKAGAG